MSSHLILNGTPDRSFKIDGTVSAGDLIQQTFTGVKAFNPQSSTYTVNNDTPILSEVVGATSASTSVMSTGKYMDAAYFSDGKYVVVFRQSNAAMAQLFNADGSVYAAEFIVNGGAATGAGPVSVVVLPDDTFVIAFSNSTTNVLVTKYSNAVTPAQFISSSIVAAVNSSVGNIRLVAAIADPGAFIVLLSNTTTNVLAYRYNSSFSQTSNIVVGTANNTTSAGGFGLTACFKANGDLVVVFNNTTTNFSFAVINPASTMTIVVAATIIGGYTSINNLIVLPITTGTLAGGFAIFLTSGSFGGGFVGLFYNSANTVVVIRSFHFELGSAAIGHLAVVPMGTGWEAAFISTTDSYNIKLVSIDASFRISSPAANVGAHVNTTGGSIILRNLGSQVMLLINSGIAANAISVKRWTHSTIDKVFTENLPPSSLFGTQLIDPTSLSYWLSSTNFAKGQVDIVALDNGNFFIAAIMPQQISFKVVSPMGELITESASIFAASLTILKLCKLPNGTIFGVYGTSTQTNSFTVTADGLTLLPISGTLMTFPSMSSCAIAPLSSGNVVILANNTSTSVYMGIWNPATALWVVTPKVILVANLVSMGTDLIAVCETTDGGFAVVTGVYNAASVTAKFDATGNFISAFAPISTAGTSTSGASNAIAPLPDGGWIVFCSYTTSLIYYSTYDSNGLAQLSAISLDGTTGAYLTSFNAVVRHDKIFLLTKTTGVTITLWQLNNVGVVTNRYAFNGISAPTICRTAINDNGTIGCIYGFTGAANNPKFISFTSDLRLLGVAQEDGVADDVIRIGVNGNLKLNRDWGNGMIINQLGYTPPGIKGRIYKDVAYLTLNKNNLN